MTAGRRTRLLATARVAAVAGCALLAGTGCRLFERKPSGGGGERAARGDPLLGGKLIPKTDLPIPSRDSAGRDRDPLLTTPASRDKPEQSAADLPGGREPYRPGPESTAAGLAARLRTDDSSLSIGDRPDRRGAAAPAGRGPVPLRPGGAANYDDAVAELKRLGVKYTDPQQDSSGEYLMRAEVPVGNDGAVRRYEGGGASPAAAAKQLLDQITGDR